MNESIQNQHIMQRITFSILLLFNAKMIYQFLHCFSLCIIYKFNKINYTIYYDIVVLSNEVRTSKESSVSPLLLYHLKLSGWTVMCHAF